MRGIAGAVTLLAAVACAGRSPRPTASPGLFEDQLVRAVVREALEADAAGRPADSLYLVGATIVQDGRVALSPPRFAGVAAGGRVALLGLAAEITPGMAWAALDYRWTAADGQVTDAGRATVVLERLGGSWRIRHVHSSSARPRPAR